MKLRDLIERLGVDEVARRLHRSPSTVKKWKGKPPKSIAPRVTAVIRRHQTAQTQANKRKRARRALGSQGREIQRLKKELAAERFGKMTYQERLQFETAKSVLVPWKLLKKISKLYGIPIRAVATDYFSPKLHGRKAA